MTSDSGLKGMAVLSRRSKADSKGVKVLLRLLFFVVHFNQMCDRLATIRRSLIACVVKQTTLWSHQRSRQSLVTAMADTEDVDGLRLQVKRLLNDLGFEKNLNSILDDIRNFAIILANNCKCDQNGRLLEKINELNLIYVQSKASKTMRTIGISHIIHH